MITRPGTKVPGRVHRTQRVGLGIGDMEKAQCIGAIRMTREARKGR